MNDEHALEDALALLTDDRELPSESCGSAAKISAIEYLHAALQATSSLSERGCKRDDLWLVLWDGVTTRGEAWVTPLGSASRVKVTADDADAELIAAWDWLEANEDCARRMGPVELYRTLRGVATKSHKGSARAANADSMCGITGVPGGAWLAIGRSPEIERCAS